MMKYLVLFLSLLSLAAHADPHFDSLFSRSHVVVIGRISRQNSEPAILEKKDNRHYINLKIEQVAMAGVALPDSSGIFLTGDTLKRFSYVTNGDSMLPYGPYVLLLVRDANAPNGWRMTEERLSAGVFDDLYLFFNRCLTYYIDAGRGQSSRVEIVHTPTEDQRITYYPNGKVMERTCHKKGSAHKVTWETTYDGGGKKIAQFRRSHKYGRTVPKTIVWCTWRNGHPALRRIVIRIID